MKNKSDNKLENESARENCWKMLRSARIRWKFYAIKKNEENKIVNTLWN